MDKIAALRALDAFDRIGPVGVFDRLTAGRTDESGAFTGGCGLTNGQAVALVGFVSGGRIGDRLKLMCDMEDKVLDPKTGETAWDRLLAMPKNEDETWDNGGRPANIGWALDDLLYVMRKKAAA